eukprot:gnl/TRDRNA2_/TRDRNA2_90320_c0_seq2.p1 gnl/TRDRNA2_/TRDRNA2_90320_c0~~gnl/TRDRNA2_/TRDRNA2_90320_c0_seq2.p1  ORF type:complete len:559 (+),score=75.61 gnl/TRDRNA2_/TRDRNA2_90320_c0_seq2:83-1759(+)
MPQESTKESCTVTTAEDAYKAEVDALFGNEKPTSLWKKTAIVFDEDAGVREVELMLSDTNWEVLMSDPGKEEYVEGGVRISGLGEWQGVGIRFKGSGSQLKTVCLQYTICNKLSYKIRFNYINSTQRFFGLKKIMLHASVNDPTMMREKLAYSLYREMGVATVRQTYVHVKLNTPNVKRIMGVHLLTENIDGRFTETFFRGGDGNLWKELWPGTQDKNLYRTLLETNEDTADVSRYMEFSNRLAATKTDVDIVKVLRNYTPAKKWARFWAVDRTVDHWDGPSNFRGSVTGQKGSFWSHNFFMYQYDRRRVRDQQFMVIPWDMDGTFPWDVPGMISVTNKNMVAGRPDFDAPVCESGGEQCIQCETYGAMIKSLPPSCVPIVRTALRGLRSDFMNASYELLAGPLQPCRINAKLERWGNLIAPFMKLDREAGVYPAMSTHKDLSWEEEFAKFRDTVVPAYIADLRDFVSCSREFDAAKWDQPVTHFELMADENDVYAANRGNPWKPQWMPKEPDTTSKAPSATTTPGAQQAEVNGAVFYARRVVLVLLPVAANLAAHAQ